MRHGTAVDRGDAQAKNRLTMTDEMLKRFGYKLTEEYDPETLAKLQEHYTAILELLGEDPQREGLRPWYGRTVCNFCRNR